jgi:hypothetical protein
MLDPTEETFGFSGTGLQPGNRKRHPLAETHLRALGPASSLLLAFEDADGQTHQQVSQMRRIEHAGVVDGDRSRFWHALHQ